jgi:hypothetical protein
MSGRIAVQVGCGLWFWEVLVGAVKKGMWYIMVESGFGSFCE